MKFFGKVLKYLICLILALILLLAVARGVFSIAEYRPASVESIVPPQQAEAVIEAGKPRSIVSWNCGYGALGDNADFFMDGGSAVYTADRERVNTNLSGIRDTLAELKPDSCPGFFSHPGKKCIGFPNPIGRIPVVALQNIVRFAAFCGSTADQHQHNQYQRGNSPHGSSSCPMSVIYLNNLLYPIFTSFARRKRRSRCSAGMDHRLFFPFQESGNPVVIRCHILALGNRLETACLTRHLAVIVK